MSSAIFQKDEAILSGAKIVRIVTTLEQLIPEKMLGSGEINPSLISPLALWLTSCKPEHVTVIFHISNKIAQIADI